MAYGPSRPGKRKQSQREMLLKISMSSLFARGPTQMVKRNLCSIQLLVKGLWKRGELSLILQPVEPSKSVLFSAAVKQFKSLNPRSESTMLVSYCGILVPFLTADKLKNLVLRKYGLLWTKKLGHMRRLPALALQIRIC